MGYSIACHAADKASFKRMAKFMAKKYRKPAKVFGLKNNYSRLATNMGKDACTHLSYDRCPLAIGFDFNSCEPERDYIFDVVRWMALKIGEKKMFKGLGKKVPYICYDGGHCLDDRWPVLVEDEWKNKVKSMKWCLVTAVGMSPLRYRFEGDGVLDKLEEKKKANYIAKRNELQKNICGFSMDEADKIIEKELQRLDKAWKKEYENR